MTSSDQDIVDAETRDDTVRQLRRLQLSTRKIARQTGLSQSTVVRILRRADATGPLPVLHAKSQVNRAQAAALWLIASAVLLLTAAVGVLAWRTGQSPAAPAPGRVIACLAHGTKGWDDQYLTGIAASQAGRCPAGWDPFLLSSAG